jgi:hypothetical protein
MDMNLYQEGPLGIGHGRGRGRQPAGQVEREHRVTGTESGGNTKKFKA